MKRGEELYSGKAKSMHLTEDPKLLIMEFRDDTSAFDGEKIEQLDRKGMVNNLFNSYDNYLRNKYIIDVNYQALDTVKNYFN